MKCRTPTLCKGQVPKPFDQASKAPQGRSGSHGWCLRRAMAKTTHLVNVTAMTVSVRKTQ